MKHFGTYTDLTYDMNTDEKEVEPCRSEIPQKIVDLTNSIKEYVENKEKEKRELEKSQTLEKKEEKHKKNSQIIYATAFPIEENMEENQRQKVEDDKSEEESSSSADFEIEKIQKNKQKKVKMSTYIFGFEKPEPEIRRIFVTHKPPLSKKKGKNIVKKQAIRLTSRLSTRRTLGFGPWEDETAEYSFKKTSIDDL